MSDAEFDRRTAKFIGDILEKSKSISKYANAFIDGFMPFVIADIEEHFRSEEGPSGKWEPWSKSYSDAVNGVVSFRTINDRVVPIKKGKLRPPRKPGLILSATGRLRKGLKATNYRKSGGSLVIFNNAKTKEGFPYAAAHNEGEGLLPQRRFMWLSDKARGKILNYCLRFMADGN